MSRTQKKTTESLRRMEGRRVRRFGAVRKGRRSTHSVLPLHNSQSHHQDHQHLSINRTISCFYCDIKFPSLNTPLSQLGIRHCKPLKAWFSIGVGFGLISLVAVSIILLLELPRSLHLHIFPQSTSFSLRSFDLSTDLLFGLSSISFSIADIGYLLFSTVISVCVHEFGHALAAASEGIQMEYFAVFIAFVLFPGALVAFDFDSLQELPRFSALRVYCAGIWHNAVCCVLCGLGLFLLPVILFPFYQYGEGALVLDVPSSSPLSGYLSSRDAIVSLDGVPIRNDQDWMEMTTLINELAFQNINNSEYVQGSNRKGYCVPNYMLEETNRNHFVEKQSDCSDYLAAFLTVPCSHSTVLSGGESQTNRIHQIYCLNAKDVIKYNKCGDGWVRVLTNVSSCICSQDESCVSPIQMPGLIWAEVTYSSPYSPKCVQVGRKPVSDLKNSGIEGSNCGGTFVFIGDVISMARSIQLTAYQPRWTLNFGTHLPSILERILICMFHVSLTLALLNSLPVYFLDGESTLEVVLCYFTLLRPGSRGRILQVWLLVGTLLSLLAFFRMILKFFAS